LFYFDNAATTFPKPEEVYSFMDAFYRQCGVNVGRGQYDLAAKASSLVSETRQLLLDLFYCPQKRVVFTSSATEALNVILQGLPWQDGMNVYITPFEHNAVLRVLHYLKSVYQLNVIELYVDKEIMDYDLEEIKYQFQDKRPDIVIMSHASNVCGLVAPIKEICAFSKCYDAINVIDMAQTAGLVDTDLNLVQADFVVLAGHKTLYGPLGIAGLILNQDVNLKPLMFGGTGIDSANPDLPKTVPERYEVGSLNIQAVAGLNAALKWIAKIGIEEIFAKERENTSKLFELLTSFKNIKTVGIKSVENHIGIISCIFDGYSSDNIGQVLNEHGVAVRTGLHCAPNAHRFLGTFPGGTVRFSMGYLNTEDDLERLSLKLSFIIENS
jgi:cysteine desulfurase family protein